MKSFKKSLVFLTISALVLGVVAPAFAASSTDVVGTNYEDAVVRMGALGIINGYPDGTFKPENNITRAEFAKIACYLIGQQDAATLSAGTATKFNDVPATHWAAGYISIASNQGIIKGYPDGTFKPEANVSYAESITMLVRALGMAPVVDGKGTWPANYMAKAAELGVTDGVTSVEGTAKATRGNIAKLSWNTLTEEKWGAKGYTDKGEVNYGGLGKTLLSDKYSDFAWPVGAAKNVNEPKILKEATVTANQLFGGLDAKKMTVKVKDAAGNYAANATPTLEVADLNVVNPAELFGKKVDLMLGKDDKVVSVKVKSDDVIEGIVEDWKVADAKVKVNAKEYVLASDAKVYVNTVEQAGGSAAAKLLAAYTATESKWAKATVVLNSDDKVQTLVLFVADQIAAGSTKQFVVKEVKTNGDVTSLKDGARMFNLDTITGVTSADNETVFVKNGKYATRADIKVGDAVTYVTVNGSLFYVVASDAKVTGKVTSVSSNYSLTVGGKEYTQAKDGNALVTKNGVAEDAVAADSSVTDYMDKDVTLTLNANGNYVYVSGSVVSSANNQYGVLTKAVWESTTPDAAGKLNKYMEVRTTSGEKKVFQVKGDKYKTAAGTVPTSAATAWNLSSGNDTNLVAGTLVQYKVDADNTVNAANLVRVANLEGAWGSNVDELSSKVDSVRSTVTAVNHDAKALRVNGVDYYYTAADTVIFNANTDSSSNKKYLEKVDGWDAISSANTENLFTANSDVSYTLNANVYVVYNQDTKIIKVLVVDVTKYMTTTNKYGVITTAQYSGLDTAGSQVWKIKVFTEGNEYTYTVANGVYDNSVALSTYAATVGDFVKFNLDSEGKFDGGANATAKWNNFLVDKSKMVANEDNNYDEFVVKAVSGNIVSFNNKKDGSAATVPTISIKSDAKVYDLTGSTPKMASVSDIKAGQTLSFTELANGQYKVVVIVK